MITRLFDGRTAEGMLSSSLKVWTTIILLLFHVVFIRDLTDKEDWGECKEDDIDEEDVEEG